MISYENSTVGWLDHYVGNHIIFIADYLQDPEIRKAVQSMEQQNGETTPVAYKRQFLRGLQEKLDANVPELEDVTHSHLQEIISLAQGDWHDIDTLEKIYQRYLEIRKGYFICTPSPTLRQ